MLTKEIFLKRFISISIIFSLYLVHVINDFFLDQSLYGDKIFNIPNNPVSYTHLTLPTNREV